MASPVSCPSAPVSSGYSAGRPAPFGVLARVLSELVGARRQRRALADLDDRLLSDVGLTRDQADAESRRPLWDAPGHWKQRP